MKEKNKPVGTVECPQKQCTETCQVFRFRPRTEGRRTVFSGKHYCECPIHGRIGADGNSTINEYILCKAKMNGPAAAADSPAKNRAPPAASSGGAPSRSPASSPQATPAKSLWRTLMDFDLE